MFAMHATLARAPNGPANVHAACTRKTYANASMPPVSATVSKGRSVARSFRGLQGTSPSQQALCSRPTRLRTRLPLRKVETAATCSPSDTDNDAAQEKISKPVVEDWEKVVSEFWTSEGVPERDLRIFARTLWRRDGMDVPRTDMKRNIQSSKSPTIPWVALLAVSMGVVSFKTRLTLDQGVTNSEIVSERSRLGVGEACSNLRRPQGCRAAGGLRKPHAPAPPRLGLPRLPVMDVSHLPRELSSNAVSNGARINKTCIRHDDFLGAERGSEVVSVFERSPALLLVEDIPSALRRAANHITHLKPVFEESEVHSILKRHPHLIYRVLYFEDYDKLPYDIQNHLWHHTDAEMAKSIEWNDQWNTWGDAEDAMKSWYEEHWDDVAFDDA
eukprot:1186437-Prorocentrum_minimum.AAC.9